MIKATAANDKLNTIFCNGFRIPTFASSGNRIESKDNTISRQKNGEMDCIWSGLISHPMPSILPFISVACSVHREPY